jgi:hypothetical protein
LDLGGLLFEYCGQSGNLLLLLGDCSFEILNLLVLLEKLIEQHRVHDIIAWDYPTMTYGSRRRDFVVKFMGLWDGMILHRATGEVVSPNAAEASSRRAINSFDTVTGLSSPARTSLPPGLLQPSTHENFEPMKTYARLTGGIALVLATLANASPVETPDKGSPLRHAILDGLRASKTMQELSQAWHAKVIFTDVNIRKSGDWAWVAVTPMSEKDSKNRTELNSGVMRNSQGRWAIVEFLPDSISAADDPTKEFRSWCAGFIRNHPQCPAAIFPSPF